MFSLLLALIYMAFISLGLPDGLLGSAWPVMHIEMNVPESYMGIVSMIISAGTIVSSLFSDKITRRLGKEYAQNLHCHFSKIEYTTGGEKKHLTFEDVVYGPDFEPVMEIIARKNF